MNTKKKWIIAAAMVGALSTVAGTAFASTTSNTGASTSTTKSQPGTQTHHARGQFKGNDSYLLGVLKVDQTTLDQDRKSGLSLADIAAKNGVSEQTVIDAVVAHEKAAIQQQVTDGKLTSAQATQREAKLSDFAKKMVEAKRFKGMEGRRPGGFGGFDLSSLATVLKVDQATLKQDLQAGQSLADIAAKNGVSEQTVIDAVVAHEKTAIQQQVTNGKLTSAQATQREANLSTEAKKMVEAKGFEHGPKPGFGGPDQSYLLSVLKVDQTTLKQDLQAGQSLADIAAKNGVSEQTVIDAIVAHEKTAIQQQVTNGKLTSAEATQREAQLSDFAKKMVEAKGFHGPRGGWHKGQPNQQKQQSSQSSATTTSQE